MSDITMKDILSDLNLNSSENGQMKNDRSPVTIWVKPEMKARYDQLQKRSGRRFSKALREALTVLIKEAEALTA